MEQWKQILMASVDTDEVGILDADVTGIKGIQDAPDGVFYSEFSEEEARAYEIYGLTKEEIALVEAM